MRTHYNPNAMVSDAPLRVRYAETDQMRVVYNSNYFIWFEIGRVELLRNLGFSYKELELDGYNLPVAEVSCRYKAPAFYDDELLIRTRVINLRASLVQFGYQVIRQPDQALLAEGETTHIVVGREKKRVPLPEKYLTPLRNAIGNEVGVLR